MSSIPAAAIAVPVSKPKKLYLSASRIDTFMTCSALYHAKYIAKLPDAGNDGSKRGSTIHDVLELLLKPRHRKHYTEAIQQDTCRESPVLWRFVRCMARHYGVNDPVNLKMIDAFIMVALKYTFFGPKGTEQILGEKDFNIEVNDSDTGLRYAIRGFIDKTFVINDKHGLLLEVVDYKSSKAKMSGDKLEDNVQSQMYQLALRHLYPEIKRRRFDFLFLAYPRKPLQEQVTLSEEQLIGFEWRLHYLQEAMEAFGDDNREDNLAAFDRDKQWLCGREGVKKDGTQAWICGARRPLDFWVLLDGAGEHVTSGFTRAELEAKLDPAKGHRIEARHHAGCPAFNHSS